MEYRAKGGRDPRGGGGRIETTKATRIFLLSGGKHGNYLLYDGMGGQSVRPFIKLNERIQRWTRRGFRHWRKAKRRRTRRWRWGETKDVEKPVPDRGRKVERLFVITFLSIRYRARLSTPLCRSFQFFPFPFFLFLFFLPPLHSCFPPPFSPFLSFENPCQPTGNAILQIFFSLPLCSPRRFSFRKFQWSACYWQHGALINSPSLVRFAYG